MDFRIRQLQCFVTLAEHLHYGRTARELYMSQPTITFQIKSLEQAIGATLFERSRHQVRLTEAGDTFRTYAASMLRLVDEARHQVRSVENRMHLKIGCGPLEQATLLPAVLRSIARDHPGFLLEVEEMTTSEQIDGLSRGTVDALLMVAPVPVRGIRFDCLRQEPLVAIVSRRSALAAQRRISVQDLREETIIAPRLKDCSVRQPFLQQLLAPYGIQPRFLEAPHSRSAQMAYVAAGEGVVIATRLAARNRTAEVVVRPFKEALPRLQLGLAAMSANTKPAMNAFRALVLACAEKTAAREEIAVRGSPAPASLG